VVLAGGTLWLLTRRRWRGAAAIIATFGLLLLLPRPEVPDRNLSILPNPLPKRLRSGTEIRIIQPNIGQEDKWQQGFADEAARRLAILSTKPGPRPRLLFWPE